MLTAILTVILFCILIIPHEFGHFITAKLLGVQVNEFSMGMGPALFQKKKGETMYSLRAVPLGGYCAMEGENEESENPRAFNNKASWKKLIVLFAGAVMNVIVALLLVIIAVMIIGMPTNKLDKVVNGSPAYTAGIRAGDTIVSIGGKSVDSWTDTVNRISGADKGDSVEIGVTRNGANHVYDVTPTVKDKRMIIGIEATVSHSFLRCAGYGAKATWNLNKEMYQGLKHLVTKGVSKNDVAGPVRIVQMVNKSANYGASSFLYLAAIISLNLAYINLLPFPALDGGRIIFVIIRKITGNMITDKVEGAVHLVGMALLLVLFVLVTWNDISMLISK